jgi:hypothetical protein
MGTGQYITAMRLRYKIPRIMIDDEVNYVNGGTFSVSNIDWREGMCEIYTRSKDPSHPMYKKFWCYVNDVTLSGTYLNKRHTDNYLKLITFCNKRHHEARNRINTPNTN